MELILLENIKGLGKLGDKVVVKAGFGRNYLLPHQKALVANKDNVAYFETQRAELEKKEIERTKDLELISSKIQDTPIHIKMKASDEGHLYGSITAELIIASLGEVGSVLNKHMVFVPHGQIRNIGNHNVEFRLSESVAFVKEILVEKE